ncbi:MucR family transcriptional regulator [Bilophila wadsworthia]|uniref:MucR family transcriptional regulator n=1 Tax=Bilophila wadsworthia TaxID=35833 RepID=UPI001D0BD063|nr:MucR family transcriptional regulator [Bilophila wadsworthia]MCB8572041.1 MucR family transcriptional regulator [Bilophila wadsworthia]
MNDYLKEALALVRAQASVRVMSEDEIMAMVKKLTVELGQIAEGPAVEACEVEATHEDPRKSIKEKSITCLECGKTFKILTRKHLATHGLDAAQYREKWGFKKDTPLVCKGLQRERRKKMKDMALWERRRGASASAPTPDAE